MKNIFEFFGLTIREKKVQSSLKNERIEFPKYNYELEFLEGLNKTSTGFFYELNNNWEGRNSILNGYWKSRFQELIGDLNPVVEEFIREELLEISLPEESLTVKELKEILKSNGLKISGKKEELVERIISEVKEKTYLRITDPVFRLTPKGGLRIQEYKEDLKQQFLNFIKTQESIFLRGEFSELEKNYFYIRSLNPDQRSIGGSIDRFAEREIKILNHLHQKKGFRQPWNFEAESEKKLRFCLAIKSIFFPYWKEYSIDCLKSLDLTSFKKLLFQEKKDAENLSDQEILIEFIEYESNYLWNFYWLEDLKKYLNGRANSRNSAYSKIIIIGSQCNCTVNPDNEDYSKNELDRIPILPRTTTCRCQYSIV